jgi:hypothetical protein
MIFILSHPTFCIVGLTSELEICKETGTDIQTIATIKHVGLMEIVYFILKELLSLYLFYFPTFWYQFLTFSNAAWYDESLRNIYGIQSEVLPNHLPQNVHRCWSG